MPRRKYKIRPVKPDLIHHSLIVSKLINIIMHDGKKSVAEGIVYSAMEIMKKQNVNPQEVMEKVAEVIGPRMTVRPRRIGGASYMVPKETTPKHRLFLAIRWIVDAARLRSNKEFHTFEEKLAAEFIDASNGKGAAFDKKQQADKLADANKVFAHFAW